MDLHSELLSKDEINNRFLIAVRELLINKIVSNKATLADAFGIKPAKLSEILNERMKAGVDMLAVLCNYYYISPDWLLMSRGDNIFRKSEKLPPVVVYDGDNEIPSYLNVKDSKSINSTPANNANSDLLTTPLMQLIKDKDITIKEQAEEIGRLKEQIRQLTIEKEKRVSGAATSHTANAG